MLRSCRSRPFPRPVNEPIQVFNHCRQPLALRFIMPLRANAESVESNESPGGSFCGKAARLRIQCTVFRLRKQRKARIWNARPDHRLGAAFQAAADSREK